MCGAPRNCWRAMTVTFGSRKICIVDSPAPSLLGGTGNAARRGRGPRRRPAKVRRRAPDRQGRTAGRRGWAHRARRAAAHGLRVDPRAAKMDGPRTSNDHGRARMTEPTVRFQPTPNPNAGKFATDRTVVQSGSRSYFSAEQAAGDPVAEALFAIPGVASVFMVADFITVTKTPQARWEDLAPRVEQVIRETLR
nr:MAG: hypothetical protein DIU52_05720 [bacterium]